MHKLLAKLRRWYTEGLTGEVTPDYARIAKLRKNDLKRLEESIRLAKENRNGR